MEVHAIRMMADKRVAMRSASARKFDQPASRARPQPPDDTVKQPFCSTKLSLSPYLAFARYLAGAHDGVDLVFAEQELDAFAHAVGHAPAALYHSTEVYRCVSHRDAVISGMVDIFKNIRAL